MNDYKELFDSLDINNPRYIDGFIFLINKILLERNSFVKSDKEGNREEFFEIIKAALSELRQNNEKIDFLAAGHSSLAFKINDKVIKIGKSRIDETKNRKEFSCTIPILRDESYKVSDNEYYTLQVSPYVDVDEITNEELYETYCKLRKEGYIWNDPTKDNVGRMTEDIDYNGYHYSKGDLVILDLEDMAYVGEITPDVVMDEICFSSYNGNVYKFETRYMEEKNKTR